MELSKIQISKLEEHNWSFWKFRMLTVLRGTELLDIVEGKILKPEKPSGEAEEGPAAAALAQYSTLLKEYLQKDSTALLVITNNISDQTLEKVIRFTTSKEVWDELHRLYEGGNEDHLYDVCLQFFRFSMNPSDDMATHISKLKNLWHNMRQELLKTEEGNKELPEFLLICKILDTLPETYFSFKSSWMLMSKKDKTVENLTSQLCAHEKALNCVDGRGDCETLAVKTENKIKKEKRVSIGKRNPDKKLKCFICKEQTHLKKDCPKKFVSQKSREESSTMMLYTVNTMDINVNQDKWYVDNGATHHVTMRGDLFQDFEHFYGSRMVTTADGKTIKAIGKGSIKFEAKLNKTASFFLRDVWYVPQISKNLFSVLAAQDKNPTSLFESKVTSCSVKLNGNVAVTGTRQRYGGLYELNCKAVPPTVAVNLVQRVDMLQLYHERMGHQNKRHVKSLIEHKLDIKTTDSGELCEGCIFGKTHRQKFGVREKATKPGERIHTDVCGPFPSSNSKFRYFVLFKDEYTRFRFVYLMRNKSEVSEKLKQMLAEAKTAGHVIKEVLSDNGGEFVNAQVQKILSELGINHRLVMPYTPEQNGVSERENRTVVESARAMMHAHEELPEKLWAELVMTAVYILNRTGPTTVNLKSPYELWFNKKPQIKHLRIIGSLCYAHVPKQRRSKLLKKAEKCVLVGYDNDDGYRLWNKNKNSLTRSRDVIFDEKPLDSNVDSESSSLYQDNGLDLILPLPNREIVTIPLGNSTLDGHGTHNEGIGTVPTDDPIMNDLGYENEVDRDGTNYDESFELGGDVEEANEGIDHEVSIPESEMHEQAGRILRDRLLLRPPEKFKDYVLNTQLTSYTEPSTFKEAMLSPESELWKKAMTSEISSLKENKTWVLDQLPKNRKALPCKWVFKVKLNADGSVDKYKARLVIKGFKQRKGVDFDQTFSPVAKMATVRAVISIAASEEMSLMQFDVSTAFLYGSLDEEIFMKQPEGYDDGSGRVCLLKKSLYGLKQAPRCWNRRILDFFKETGFKISDADPCLFIRKDEVGKLIVALYVDDGLIAGSNQKLIDEFLDQMKCHFKITTKPASYFLGIEIETREDGLKICQTSYTKKMIQKFGMQHCRPVTTPIIKDNVCLNNKETSVDGIINNYRQIVGALAYLMVGTRPDIAYSVSVVSRSLENPTVNDCIRLKRILRYLQYCPDYGILYKKNYKKGLLECFSDADHGGDIGTGRSTSGVLCMYAGGAISWMSQRQQSVAISTTEAEVVAASEGARECIWLTRLMKDISEIKNVPTLLLDNEAAIRLAENPEFHRRTKHIRIRHFFVRELVTSGQLKVGKITSDLQLADIFTKPLARPRLKKLSELIGLHVERRC